MKVIAAKKDLEEALTQLRQVVSPRNCIPAHNFVDFRAGDSVLWLAAADLNCSLKLMCPAEILQPGTVAIPLDKLWRITKQFPAEQFHFSRVDAERLQIDAGSVGTRLKVLSSDEFPRLPTVTPKREVVLSAETWLDILGKTEPILPGEGSRFFSEVASSLLMKLTGPEMVFVATDGHRLTRLILRSPSSPIAGPSDLSTLIPKQVLRILGRLLTSESEVTLGITEHLGEFRTPEASLRFRRVPGEYPEYERSLPNEEFSKTRVNREALIGAIDRIESIVGRAETARIEVKFMPSRLGLRVSREDSDAWEEVEAVRDEPEAHELDLNPRYLLEPLQAMRSEIVRLSLGKSWGATDSDLSMLLLRGPKDEGFLHLLMGMRRDSE